MPALREIFADFGIQFDRKRALQKGDRAVKKTTRSLKKLERQEKKTSVSSKAMGRAVEGAGNAVKGLGAALGLAALAQGFRTITQGSIDSTRELTRWSARLGLSEEDMYSWARVAARFGGDTEDIADAFKELQLKSRDAMTGGGLAGDAWKLLGIQMSEIEPIINDQQALMDKFIGGLNGVDEATRRFVIDEVMSDAGTRLTEMFEVGVPGLRAMRAEVSELGGRSFPQLAQQTRTYTQAAARLNDTWVAARDALMLHILPLLTKGAEKLRDLVTAARSVIERSNILEAALYAVGAAATAAGVAAAVAWGPAIVTVLAVAAGVAALILIIDDLITFMRDDGDTVTEEFLKWLTGLDDVTAQAETLRTVINGIVEVLGFVADTMTLLGSFSPGGLIRMAMGGSNVAPLAERITGYIRGATGEDEPIRVSEEGLARADDIRWGGPEEDPNAGRSSVWGPAPNVATVSSPTVAARNARPRVDVQAPVNVAVTVNEATDTAGVQQAVETSVRAATSEWEDNMARDFGDMITDNERTMLEGE